MILNNYLKQLQEQAEAEVNYNINEYFDRLRKTIEKNKSAVIEKVLGYTREYPILFLHPRKILNAPTILIAAGFHGDESSGPWAVLNFLESNSYPGKVNASFLPLVNPTGFNLSRRADFWGVQPNRGFTKSYDNSPPSQEDDILKKNISTLSEYGKDRLITLHEDDEENFYMFIYGKKDNLETKILSMGEDKFGLAPSKRLSSARFKSPEDGIITNDKDGSFEHGMLVKGIKKNITTENPARRPFKERVELYIDIIKEVCNPNYYR